MNSLENASDKLTQIIGTPVSILIHTFLFVGIFSLKFVGYGVDQILLILTTLVSLESIYLSIFIQMSVNKTSKSLEGVEKDIDEIQEDVDEIQEDVDEIQEDVDDIQEDVEDLSEEEEEDQVIATIKDIEQRLILLHKEIVEINEKNNKEKETN